MVQKIIKPFSARLLQRMLGRFQYGALQEKYGNESKEEGSWEFKSACNDLGYIHHWRKKTCYDQEMMSHTIRAKSLFSSHNPDCQTLVRWKLFTHSHTKHKRNSSEKKFKYCHCSFNCMSFQTQNPSERMWKHHKKKLSTRPVCYISTLLKPYDRNCLRSLRC